MNKMRIYKVNVDIDLFINRTRMSGSNYRRVLSSRLSPVLKQFFINVSYHISLTLMALF